MHNNAIRIFPYLEKLENTIDLSSYLHLTPVYCWVPKRESMGNNTKKCTNVMKKAVFTILTHIKTGCPRSLSCEERIGCRKKKDQAIIMACILFVQDGPATKCCSHIKQILILHKRFVKCSERLDTK